MTRRSVELAIFPALLGLVFACGDAADTQVPTPPPPPPKDFGQYELASTAELCEGVAGLSADAILAERTDHIETTLAYITAQGARVDPSALTIDLTWPSTPAVVCYPPYSEVGLNPAEARLAIDGLTMSFSTADGKFDETLDAKAWLISTGGVLGDPTILAVRSVAQLSGTFTPPPEIITNPNLLFTTRFVSPTPNSSQGLIGMTTQFPEDLQAAVFIGSIAAAIWPHP